MQWTGGRWARIEARVANPIGTGSADLRRTGFAPIGRDIYFTVSTDTPQPYDIWWKSATTDRTPRMPTAYMVGSRQGVDRGSMSAPGIGVGITWRYGSSRTARPSPVITTT